MKATGIVRRIDDLGRIVIPKEIRRTLRIRETDPVEIFTDREGQVILRKYSPMGELAEFARQYAESLYQVSGHPALIADREHFIACAGGYRHFMGKNLSRALMEKCKSREAVFATRDDRYFISVCEESGSYLYEAIAPIVCEGDLIGTVLLLEDNPRNKMGEVEQKLVLSAASFLGKQMEQ